MEKKIMTMMIKWMRYTFNTIQKKFSM